MKSLALLLLAASVRAAQAPRLEQAYTIAGAAGSVIFSADGKTLVMTGTSGVTVFDAEIGVQRGLLAFKSGKCGSAEVYCGTDLLALSPDGRIIAVDAWKRSYHGKFTSGDLPYKTNSMEYEGSIELWDTATEKKVRVVKEYGNVCRMTGSGFQPWQCITGHAAFSPDGKRLAFGWWTPKADYTLEGRENWVAELPRGRPKKIDGEGFFTPDGRLLTLVVRGNSAQIMDEDAGKRLSFLQNFELNKVQNVFFSGDGSAVAVFTYFESVDHKIQIWDAATGRSLLEKRWADKDVYTRMPLLTGDGRRAIIVPNGSAPTEVHDLPSSGEHAQAALPLSEGWGVSISPDGRMLAGRMSGPRVGVFRLFWDGAPPPQAPKAEPSAKLNVDAPPAAKTPADPDAYAVVIGIEKYRQAGLPPVEYAARDAETMRRYLVESMGFDAANVALLKNEEATKTDLDKHLGPWLANRVTAKSRVFVYYAGHGAPNPATGQGFLVPYEGDPNYTDVTAYPIQGLYDNLAKLAAKEVTVVLDACFSGSGGRSLLAKGARPLVQSVKASAGSNTTVLSAATGAQISSSYPEGKHGLLSYFLFEGLHGGADENKDGAVTTAELFAYARGRVEREARKQNVEQTPSLAGGGDGVWLRR